MMNRHFLSAAILICYFIPMLFFSGYSIGLMSHDKSWSLLSFGLLLVACGTLCLIFLVRFWEQIQDEKRHEGIASRLIPLLPQVAKETKVTSLDSSLTFNSSYPELVEQGGNKENSKEFNLLQTALKESQEQQEKLTQTLEQKNQEIQKLNDQNVELRHQAHQVAQDFSDYKLFSEEQIKQKQLQLSNFQQMVEDQRTEMEKRQEQIYQLDTKVHDLSYEIKTLLYLHDSETGGHKSSPVKSEETIHPSALKTLPTIEQSLLSQALDEQPDQDIYHVENQIRTPAEAIHLLKKCINIAQKLTGANYYNNEISRYRELSSSYNTIDQRRLFEALRNETSALIVVYSQKENKLLFANPQSKVICGWSSEKFITDFHSIIQEGLPDWKRALSHLATNSESQTRLLAKTKQGQEVLLNCQLGTIPTGLFRLHVIGVFYNA